MPWEMTSTVAPPRNRKNTNSPMVANIPRLARKLMPFSTPDVAEIRNRVVTTHDDDHGHRVGLRYVEEVLEAAVELEAVEAESGRRSEQGGDDGQGVHDPAQWALARVGAQDWGERRADQRGQPLAEAEVRHGAAHDGVQGPAVEAPVEVGVPERDQARLLSARLRQTVRRGDPVRNRLGGAEEEQSGPEPGGEHHRHPGEGSEVRAGVVGPETDVPPGMDDQEDAQRQARRTR